MKALPVLAVILGEMGLFGSRISNLARGVAGVNDIALWVVLGILLTAAAAGHAGQGHGLTAVWLLALRRPARTVIERRRWLAGAPPHIKSDRRSLGANTVSHRTV
jgi:hypothetical protein